MANVLKKKAARSVTLWGQPPPAVRRERRSARLFAGAKLTSPAGAVFGKAEL